MNKIVMKKILTALPLMAGMVIGTLATGCSGKKEKKDTSSLPEEVRPVADAILEDSPEKFAAAVAYPVERPYPLRNVTDSAEMVKYYHKMVDSKLKKAVEEAPDSIWLEEGWRGWTLGNGSYFYIDSGKIYAMNYVSDEEAIMLDSLRHEEIITLEPVMQAGWTPVTCVIDTISGAVFRIDCQDSANPPVYRLSGYSDTTDLSSSPSLMLYGHLDLEGTMGNRFYEFTDSLGETTAYYSPDQVTDEEEPEIEVDRKGSQKRYKAKPDYWLDQVSRRRAAREAAMQRNDSNHTASDFSTRGVTLRLDSVPTDSAVKTQPVR